MDSQALIALANVYARRMAAAWTTAAAAYPDHDDPARDGGLFDLWGELAGVYPALAEEHGSRLLALGICRRDGTLDELAFEMMNRLTPAEIAASLGHTGGRRGSR
jgi:hypothetical protein